MREAISIFFERLSVRLTKENHLSDLLWALCETVPGLADNLWELCTDGSKCDQKPIVFREHPLIYDQRADFAMFAGSELLLIENKIYDRNYHFRDYASAALAVVHVAKVRKCLITAHPLDQRSCHEAREHGWHVLPWSEVVKHLLRQDFEDLQPLIDAFVCYAREVCGMKEIQQIRLDQATLKGVFHLANLVEKLSYASTSSLRASRCGARCSGVFSDLAIRRPS